MELYKALHLNVNSGYCRPLMTNTTFLKFLPLWCVVVCEDFAKQLGNVRGGPKSPRSPFGLHVTHKLKINHVCLPRTCFLGPDSFGAQAHGLCGVSRRGPPMEDWQVSGQSPLGSCHHLGRREVSYGDLSCRRYTDGPSPQLRTAVSAQSKQNSMTG
jgi:hypothetical protein